MFGHLLDLIDGCLASLLADNARVVCWAVLAGAASMGLYTVASPQRKLKALADESSAARQALSRYDGDFAGAWPLMRKSLSSSLKRLALVLVPSLVAGVPVIVLLFWLDCRYGYEMPEPGETVAVEIVPRTAAVFWQPLDTAIASAEGRWLVHWPQPDQAIRLLSAEGIELLTLPGGEAAPTIGRPSMWDVFLQSRSSLLPAESPIESVHFGFARREALSFGPTWARSPLALFLVVICLSSLVIKGAFRIA